MIIVGGMFGILILFLIMLIVMGLVFEVLMFDFFRGVFISGVLLVLFYLFYILGCCWLNFEFGLILVEED